MTTTSTRKPPLVIYHDNCLDGFAAAWAAWKSYPAAEFVPATHGKAPPDVTGRAVIIVDFSYPRGTLLEMAAAALDILIIDHHKTAAEALAAPLPKNVTTVFDMDFSGCVLAWKASSSLPAPPLLLHIQDRDLWQFKMEGTREIAAALGAAERSFAHWDDLIANWDERREQLLAIGRAILARDEAIMSPMLAGGGRGLAIGGFVVPAINAPAFLASELGNRLAQGNPFAAVYHDTALLRVFSLRSTDDGEDVSAIAKQYGGGGHRNAAGFNVPLGHPLAYGDTAAMVAVAPMPDAVWEDGEPANLFAAGHDAYAWLSWLQQHARAILMKPEDQGRLDRCMVALISFLQPNP